VSWRREGGDGAVGDYIQLKLGRCLARTLMTFASVLWQERRFACGDGEW
jgi:hypothetical protein